MSCSCSGGSDFKNSMQVLVVRPRIDRRILPWLSKFSDNRSNCRSLSARIEYQMRESHTNLNATGTVTSSVHGNLFATIHHRTYPQLRLRAGELESQGFDINQLQNLTFTTALAYDGERTYQYSNANGRAHVFEGNHPASHQRMTADLFTFREPYRQLAWDELLTAASVQYGSYSAPVTTTRIDENEKIGARPCLFVETLIGDPDNGSLVRTWLDLGAGGIPIKVELAICAPGSDPLLVERLDEVSTALIGGVHLVTDARRTVWGYSAGLVAIDEQVTSYKFLDQQVNLEVTKESLRAVIPTGVSTWSESTRTLDGGPIGDDVLPRGRKDELEDFRCTDDKVNCTKSDCVAGPGRPFICNYCSGGGVTIVTSCVQYQFQKCKGVWTLCGTWHQGTCFILGTCTGGVDKFTPCSVFDCS